MSLILRKTIGELKALEEINLEQFLKLFGIKGRSEFLLSILDREVQKEDQNKRKELETVCKPIFNYIKELTNIYQRTKEEITEDEKIILRYRKSLVVNKLNELYSVQGAKSIIEYAKRLGDDNNTLLDKSIKTLIFKEYISYKGNDISSYRFPHGHITEHYTLVTQWWKSLEYSGSGYITIQVFTEFLKQYKIAYSP